MTFYQYLETLKDEDSPAGDLARDAMRDQYFPREVTSRKQLRDYLMGCRACTGALEALDQAWNRYRRRKRKFT